MNGFDQGYGMQPGMQMMSPQMAMLNAYRQGAGMDAMRAMNPTMARPAQFLPPELPKIDFMAQFMKQKQDTEAAENARNLAASRKNESGGSEGWSGGYSNTTDEGLNYGYGYGDYGSDVATNSSGGSGDK